LSPVVSKMGSSVSHNSSDRGAASKERTYGELLECIGHLLVVALYRRRAVRLELALANRVLAPDEVVEDRGRYDALVARSCLLPLSVPNRLLAQTHRTQTLCESGRELLSGRPSVASKDDARLDREVNVQRLDEVLEDLDELARRGSVADLGSVSLPAGLEHLSSRVDELDTVVSGWVVRRRDHDSNDLASDLL
jgi:hypothetical protein